MSDGLRVLCVAAHPDDIEFSCAGAVARWVDEGADAAYVIVTDGSTGTEDPEMAGAKLAAIRREETMAAAKVAGVEVVEFLGYRDGYLEPTLELRRDIARAFRKYRPHRFVVPDPAPLPGGWFVNHPDHRAVGHACLDVTITAGTTPGHFPELLDEGLAPWRGLREIYIAGPAGGETVVDITSTVDRKVAALLCHASQVGGWDVATAVRSWTADYGRPHGFAHAEAFHVLTPLRPDTGETEAAAQS
ncbi:MAG TPA: PIG-L deacetylase family protein [Actinomycetota bacterium]|nr:PIG-L deacetylase family protein [Actinomycetota bacterium]